MYMNKMVYILISYKRHVCHCGGAAVRNAEI